MDVEKILKYKDIEPIAKKAKEHFEKSGIRMSDITNPIVKCENLLQLIDAPDDILLANLNEARLMVLSLIEKLQKVSKYFPATNGIPSLKDILEALNISLENIKKKISDIKIRKNEFKLIASLLDIEKKILRAWKKYL